MRWPFSLQLFTCSEIFPQSSPPCRKQHHWKIKQSTVRWWDIIKTQDLLTKFDINYIYLFIGYSSMLNEITIHIGQNEFACHKQSQPQSVRSLLETIPPPFQSNYWFTHTTADSPWQFFRVHMQFSKHPPPPPKCNYLSYRTYDVKFVKKVPVFTFLQSMSLH